jgi:uncharacterized protein YndB with AHSA1/START domain
MPEVKIEPIRKQLKVSLPPAQAFHLFTEGIGQWWPLGTHSVGEDQADTCSFEGRVGGRILETLKDGSQAEWGRVLAWEPPTLVSFQWYPGRSPDTAQEVTVQFREHEGGTSVELVHSGWEVLGEKAPSTRSGYDIGWDFVLAKYIVCAAGG